MAQAGDNKSQMSELEKELLPLNVLLHCRTVVEGKNVLTTGVLTHLEGELFEVEIHEYEQFELGETVKLTIYSPAGIQSMPSIVFAKYEGAIALLQPPDLQKRFKERREHPRVEISGNARIVRVLNDNGEDLPYEEGAELTVHDISLSGISFSGKDAPYFAANSKLKVTVNIGVGFSCEIEIVRRELQENMAYFGAKMQVLEPEMLRPLRALILRQQVEMNAQARRDIGAKKSFNGK
ncbi:PilZ domain-containing protein [Cohnella lupini]|uniref:PilZ domain-containing protein n=1 Tax=Cohnella lupini TaxID=1294267 RepID=A0A3D9I5E1_9BACL|nr:PilZ domain-containing protein [Cohnella lupini]RED56739.1 PilZ domain-containing protein [Cohnella lupini]